MEIRGFGAFRTEDQETYKTSQSKISHKLVSQISPIYSDNQQLPKRTYEPRDLFSNDLNLVADCLFNSKQSEL